MILAVVGSGGKTTRIKELAAHYRSQKKSVLVTTTTHMFIEEDTLLTDEAEPILRRLRETGYAMAGVPEGNKIRSLSPETFREVCRYADIVLVEADGSKHMPLKYPNASEPVIPENVDKILVIWGPHGLGKPACQVCHRLELVLECLGIEEDTLMTRAHVQKLIHTGYLSPLRAKFPNAEIQVSPPL